MVVLASHLALLDHRLLEAAAAVVEPMGFQVKLLEPELMVAGTGQMQETDQPVLQIEAAVAVARLILHWLAAATAALVLCLLKFHQPILQHSLVA
jgi:hypothetical protein